MDSKNVDHDRDVALGARRECRWQGGETDHVQICKKDDVKDEAEAWRVHDHARKESSSDYHTYVDNVFERAKLEKLRRPAGSPITRESSSESALR